MAGRRIADTTNNCLWNGYDSFVAQKISRGGRKGAATQRKSIAAFIAS
jgi:hypothetical protein